MRDTADAGTQWNGAARVAARPAVGTATASSQIRNATVSREMQLETATRNARVAVETSATAAPMNTSGFRGGGFARVGGTVASLKHDRTIGTVQRVVEDGATPAPKGDAPARHTHSSGMSHEPRVRGTMGLLDGWLCDDSYERAVFSAARSESAIAAAALRSKTRFRSA